MDKKAGSKKSTEAKITLQVGFYGYNTTSSTQIFDKWHTFSNDILIIDDYSKNPKLYGMEKTTTEEVMDKLYMFQSRSGNDSWR